MPTIIPSPSIGERKRQRGNTLLIVLSSMLGGAALAFLFVYLPLINAKEEEAQKQLMEARKAAELSSRQAAEARAQLAEAEIRFGGPRVQAGQIRNPGTGNSIGDMDQRAVLMQQQRIDAMNRQEANRRRMEQEQIARRAAIDQRELDELRLRCESYKKLPNSPSKESLVYQACARYDDAVRRQNYEALNQQYVR